MKATTARFADMRARSDRGEGLNGDDALFLFHFANAVNVRRADRVERVIQGHDATMQRQNQVFRDTLEQVLRVTSSYLEQTVKERGGEDVALGAAMAIGHIAGLIEEGKRAAREVKKRGPYKSKAARKRERQRRRATVLHAAEVAAYEVTSGQQVSVASSAPNAPNVKGESTCD